MLGFDDLWDTTHSFRRKFLRRGMRYVFVGSVCKSVKCFYICCLQEKSNFKYYIMAQTIKKQLGGVAYCAPSVSVLDVEAEGLLCLSAEGSSIEPGTEENWGEL